MIANARMYSVSPRAAALWRQLLSSVIARSGLDIELIEHAGPAPIEELWQRSDMAAVFMCGLPYARAEPRPQLIAAPVPSPAAFLGRPKYWSEWVVRTDSPARRIEDTFGGRIALTVAHSQSGFLAALTDIRGRAHAFPPYRELIAPQITPQGALCAVLEDRADVAPIDAYALCLLQAFRSELTAAVRVIGRTAAAPIPPLVSSIGRLEALEAAFLDADRIPAVRPLMSALLLQRFVRPEPAAYDELRARYAAAMHYWSEHPFAAAVHPKFAELRQARAQQPPVR